MFELNFISVVIFIGTKKIILGNIEDYIATNILVFIKVFFISHMILKPYIIKI